MMKKNLSPIEEAYFKVITLKVADLIKKVRKFHRTKDEITLPPPVLPMRAASQKQACRLIKERASLFNEVGIYIHLPFCSYRCAFCNYTTAVKPTDAFINKYLNALKNEIELMMELLGRNSLPTNSIYIGGGTPTYLSKRQIKDILGFIFKKTTTPEDIEITFEASPETLTAEKIDVLLENKVNRLSIGFQVFENRLLRFMNRKHSVARSISAFKLARKRGFKNIDIDLIYGLPGQSMEDWQHSLDEVIKLRPTSIYTYHLFLGYGSKWYSIFRKKKECPIKNLALSALAIDKLSKAGYIQKSLYRFILPSEYPFQKRSFMDQLHKLAFGASGRSRIDDLIYINHRSIANYIDYVAKGKIPISKIRVLNINDKIALNIFNAAERFSLNKNVFSNQFGFSIEDILGEPLAKLEELSLITDTSSSINLTYKGIIFLQELWTYYFLKYIRLYLQDKKIS